MKLVAHPLKADAQFAWDPDIPDKHLPRPKTHCLEHLCLSSLVQTDFTVGCFHNCACLMQDNYPIAYASRSPRAREKSCAQIEKETLAAVFGVEYFEN